MPTVSERVSVVETEIKNIESKLVDIKEDVKEVSEEVKTSHSVLLQQLAQMSQEGKQAHEALGKKISAIEKWRWTLMGVGVAVGYMASHSALFVKLFG